MKRNFKVMWLMIAMMLVMVFPMSASAKVKLSKKTVSLYVGQKYQLNLTGTTNKAKWSSSNSTVAGIRNGLITAKKSGKATVTAKVGKKKYKCKVNVKNMPALCMNRSAANISVGQFFTLTVTGQIGAVSWTSSNNAVVKVNANGLVTGIAAGTAVITAKDGNRTATCQVTVTKTTNTVVTPSATTKPTVTTKPSVSTTPSNPAEIIPTVDKVKYESARTVENHVLIFAKNNNSVPVEIEATVVFYNESGQMIDLHTSYSNDCLGAGKTAVLSVHGAYNRYNSANVDYSNYTVKLSVKKSEYKDDSSYIGTEVSLTEDNVVVLYTNKGAKVSRIGSTVIFYDANGKVLDYARYYPGCYNAGTVDYYVTEYSKKLNPASCKVYIDYAHSYTKN